MRWALAGQQNGGITMLQFVSALAIVAVAIVGGVFKLLEIRMTANKREILQRNSDEHADTAKANAATQRLIVTSVSSLMTGQAQIVERLDIQDMRAAAEKLATESWRAGVVERLDIQDMRAAAEIPITNKETPA